MKSKRQADKNVPNTRHVTYAEMGAQIVTGWGRSVVSVNHGVQSISNQERMLAVLSHACRRLDHLISIFEHGLPQPGPSVATMPGGPVKVKPAVTSGHSVSNLDKHIERVVRQWLESADKLSADGPERAAGLAQLKRIEQRAAMVRSQAIIKEAESMGESPVQRAVPVTATEAEKLPEHDVYLQRVETLTQNFKANRARKQWADTEAVKAEKAAADAKAAKAKAEKAEKIAAAKARNLKAKEHEAKRRKQQEERQTQIDNRLLAELNHRNAEVTAKQNSENRVATDQAAVTGEVVPELPIPIPPPAIIANLSAVVPADMTSYDNVIKSVHEQVILLRMTQFEYKLRDFELTRGPIPPALRLHYTEKWRAIANHNPTVAPTATVLPVSWWAGFDFRIEMGTAAYLWWYGKPKPIGG